LAVIEETHLVALMLLAVAQKWMTTLKVVGTLLGELGSIPTHGFETAAEARG